MAGNRNITVIPARNRIGSAVAAEEKAKLRVAAYCRVSTDSEEQASSYEVQIDHYTRFISGNPEWELAGIFADDGISGTNTKKRDEFNRMIRECMAGNIDMVVTKSISRFARNTLDCLKYIRMLKDRNIPVYFEKENINTLDSKGEIMLTIMASLAQQESQSLSQNVKLGIQFRYQQGEMHINHNRFLGYTKDEYRKLAVVPGEAEVVKRIYREFLEGATLRGICRGLEADGILTGAGMRKWWPETVKEILRNEKYIGDALLQKTYTVDFLTKKRVTNSGIVPQYYVENSHEAIIPKEIYLQAQEELARRANLKSGALGKKRMHSAKSALAGIVFCGECGELYRRVHWDIRGKKTIVWRCAGRLEGKGSLCKSPTVPEEKLRQCVVRAINMAVGKENGFLSVLRKNVDTVLGGQSHMDTESINEKLDGLQKELLRRADSGERYMDIAGEIVSFRGLRRETVSKNINNKEVDKRLSDMWEYIDSQNGVIFQFDNRLVQRLVERITINKDKITVYYQSGTKIELMWPIH